MAWNSELVPGSLRDNLLPYAGRWVALLDGKVVGQGNSAQQAMQAAKANRYKETPQVVYVPTKSQIIVSPLIDEISKFIPQEQRVFIVGGAVRDALLSRPIHDFDFVLSGDALRIARKLADKLGAAYYPLDAERGTARVIYTDQAGMRHTLDFATMLDHDLEKDLTGRDFTINAMAVDLREPQALIDPLGGVSDLHSKSLQACSPESIQSDPVRILRAVRFAAVYDLQISTQTRQQMRQSIEGLAGVSAERLRDELFRILGGPRVATSLRALDMLGVMAYLLPELEALKGLEQSPPHIHDAWNHTLDTVRQLEYLISVLGDQHDPNSSGNLIAGLSAIRLGRFRSQLRELLNSSLVGDRNLQSLLFLAALCHDIGKPACQKQTNATGRIQYLQHERIGAEIVSDRGRALHLGRAEIAWLEKVVRHHMRPTWLAREEGPPRARTIYRFYRDTGQAGVGVCVLSLADLLATYGPTISQERFERQLDIVRALLSAWWELNDQQVNPPVLLSGNDIMDHCDLEPGKLIGEILEAVREAQVEKRVQNRQDALEFVSTYLQGR